MSTREWLNSESERLREGMAELNRDIHDLEHALAEERAAHESTKEDYHETIVNFGRERMKVARVEALAAEWEMSGGMLTVAGMALRLRAALAGDA